MVEVVRYFASNSAIWIAFNAAPFKSWSPQTQKAKPFSREESSLTRPTWQLFFPEARIGMGYFFELGSSTSSKPGNFASTSRA